MKKTVYLVDLGWLLVIGKDEEAEIYANVYDKKYGYYDTEQYYAFSKKKAIDDAKAYMSSDPEGKYAIVTEQELGYEELYYGDYDLDRAYYGEDAIVYMDRRDAKGKEIK